jgi:ureidoglycolate lyase
MKLLRFGPPGREKPGLLDAEGIIRDLSAVVDDIAGDVLGSEMLAKLSMLDAAKLPRVDEGVRIGACVGSVGKFVCIGLNFSDHAAESNLPIPSEPVVFGKWTSAIVGPNDDIEIPRGSQKTDWEVELGVVIGRTARYVSRDAALDYVWGYTIVNDASARDFQFITSQWMAGKIFETAAPVGPYLADRQEIADPHSLGLRTIVNGKQMQNGNTKTFIFDVRYLISYLSGLMTLSPGDLIATGTPPGVGFAMKPNPVFLQPGDVCRVEIDALGSMDNPVKEA